MIDEAGLGVHACSCLFSKKLLKLSYILLNKWQYIMKWSDRDKGLMQELNAIRTARFVSTSDSVKTLNKLWTVVSTDTWCTS